METVFISARHVPRLLLFHVIEKVSRLTPIFHVLHMCRSTFNRFDVFVCFVIIPPDFYPAYRRLKARKGWEKWVGFGLYGPLRASTRLYLYTPLRACTRGKNKVDHG